MNKLQYFILLMLVLSTYGKNKTSRIVGGNLAKDWQFPYFAQLEIKNKIVKNEVQYVKTVLICGGSLIRPEWILSAAHCFYYFKDKLTEMADQDLLKVYMGTVLRFDEDADINFIDKVVLHNLFEEADLFVNGITFKGFINDIAVAKLKDPYTLGQHVGLIYLPVPRNHYETTSSRCATGTIVGIGLIQPVTNPSQFDYHENVMYATVNPKTISQLRVSSDYPITKFYIEIPWQEGNPLPGDFGGPFECNFEGVPVLYGILSSGPSVLTNTSTSLVAYEEVDKQMQFILKEVPGAKWQIYVKRKKRVEKVQSAVSTSNGFSTTSLSFCILFLLLI